jgi:hypothetical protein
LLGVNAFTINQSICVERSNKIPQPTFSSSDSNSQRLIILA